MHSGRSRSRRIWCSSIAVLAVGLTSWGCAGGRGLRPEYEYEEELYLSLDGSATVNVNASVASLVALRGADFDPDPLARIDRNRLRRFFGAPDTDVAVSLARRDGRRMVHATVRVDDLGDLERVPAFAWSQYELTRKDGVLDFRQTVGPPAAPPPGLSWTGEEITVFRMHLPSEIVVHNAPSGTIERGNILEWEQPLAARLEGTPLDLHVQFEETSILSRTLLLFGATIVAAMAAVAAVIWWVSRRGQADAV